MKVIVVILLLGVVEAGGYNSLLDFPGPGNTEDYVVLDANFTSLSAYTVCTWVLRVHSDNSRYFFSYGTKTSHQDIIIGVYSTKWGNWDRTGVGYRAYSSQIAGRNQWYHTCYTWSTSGEGTVFVNGVPGPTSTRMSKQVKVGDGVLAIGQHQGSPGVFSARNAFIGRLYNLNFWDRVLSTVEIVDMYEGRFCGRLTSAMKEGIIISWDDIVAEKIAGAASLQDAQCLEPSDSPGRGTIMRFPLEVSISNYVKFHPRFGVLHAFTACTWLYKSYTTGNRYFFSYADITSNDAILIGENAEGLGLWLKDGTAMIYSGRLEVETWYHTCFVWDSAEGSAVYVSGEVAALMKKEMVGNIQAEGGLVVIGQDQDSLGGGFDKNQAFAGKLYNFNMFSRALSSDEIAAMYRSGFCGSVDNLIDDLVVSWNNIVNLPVYGDITFDSGEDAWLHGSPACSCMVGPEEPEPSEEVEPVEPEPSEEPVEPERECTWETAGDIRNYADGNGVFQGHTDAQKACLAFDECNGISCDRNDRCWLKTGVEHIHIRNGHTVYRLTCG